MKSNLLLKYMISFIGWQTSRKLIIFTSDDWGSVRVASAHARQNLIANGFNMDSNRFNKYDTLESESDLSSLFDVLLKHKDASGNAAIFTALTNVANPDFKKIAESGFTEYYYEPFTETVKRYPEHSKVYELYKQGIAENIFHPEFHGREHLNVNRWMKALQKGNKNARLAFDNEFYLADKENMLTEGAGNFGAAFDLDDISEISNHKQIIEDGLKLFEQLFNYKATLFTAPSLVHNNSVEETLADCGIKVIDVPTIQKMPVGNNKYKSKFRFLGHKNNMGQQYLIRNAVFEPNMSTTDNGVNSCLNSLEMAFRFKKPAIISNHRAAFTGGINIANRKKGIQALDELLIKILKKWPDAEFVSVAGLYDIMNADTRFKK